MKNIIILHILFEIEIEITVNSTTALVVEIDLIDIENQVAAYLGGEPDVQPLPVCFLCEEDCDECFVNHSSDFNECNSIGLCLDCQYKVECWMGKSDIPIPKVEDGLPVKPACFNCLDTCRGCKRVDNPKYCIQCSKCAEDVKADCSVPKGLMTIYRKIG